MKSILNVVNETFVSSSGDTWETNAKSRGYKVMKNMTRHDGDSTPGFHIAKDKDGNRRGEYDSKKNFGHLEESNLSEGADLYCPKCDDNLGKESEYRANYGKKIYCGRCGYDSHPAPPAHKANSVPVKPVKEGYGDTKSSLKIVRIYDKGNHQARVYKDTDFGEHRVKFYHKGDHLKNADYHTDDASDAHATAQAQLKTMAHPDAKGNFNEATIEIETMKSFSDFIAEDKTHARYIVHDHNGQQQGKVHNELNRAQSAADSLETKSGRVHLVHKVEPHPDGGHHITASWEISPSNSHVKGYHWLKWSHNDAHPRKVQLKEDLTEAKKHPVDSTADGIEKHYDAFKKALQFADTDHLHVLHGWNMGQSGAADHPITPHIKAELKSRGHTPSDAKFNAACKKTGYQGTD
jgi:ribosomal protein S27AE